MTGKPAMKGKVETTGFVPFEKRSLRGDVIAMFCYLRGCYKEEGDPIFTRSYVEKTRNNGNKLLMGRFWLDIGIKFSTMKTTSRWNNLPREVVDSPVLGTSKIHLDKVLDHLVLNLNYL